MGSLRYKGIHFVAYPNDHSPRHVHCFTGESEVIVDLLASGDVDLADREDAVRPANAKRSEVSKILTAAAAKFDELVSLWERMHGNS